MKYALIVVAMHQTSNVLKVVGSCVNVGMNGVSMRLGDSKQEHQEKLARKRKQLEHRGWSEIRITQYLKDWGKFNVKPYGK